MKHSRLTYKLLFDTDEITKLWARFGEAIGSEVLRDSYGDYWPRRPIRGEMVFSWCEGHKIDEIIGWSAIRKDPVDPAIWVIVGIFPGHQNQKYVTDIFNQTIDKGFQVFHDVQWAFVAVSKKNPRFIEHHDRLSKETCRWGKVGEINIPEPGYVIFGRKKNVEEITR